jgi:hypothetical protein
MTPHPHSTPRKVPGADRPAVRLCGERAPEPGHVCGFFDNETQKYDILAEYFRDAISAGDHLINIVEADTMADHVRQLEARAVPVEEAIRTSRLTLNDAESTYLRDGTVDVDGVFEMVRDTLATAGQQGRSVRTCGDMGWIARVPDAITAAMAYEARVNTLLPTCGCTLLCLYDLSRMPAFLVADVLATHEYAIMNGRLHRNPYYVPPTEYLAMLEQRGVSARVPLQ